VSTTLADARPAVAAARVLLADLHLVDGAALALLQELRAIKAVGGRPRVLLVAQPHDDAEVFAALRTGADSFVRAAEASAEPEPVIRRVLRGESAISPAIARQVLAFFGESAAVSLATPLNERALDWSTDAQNPLRLSRAERHMLVLFAQGAGIGPIAARLGVSVESVGRRTANVYRKLQWELRSGSLSLQAA
jgi:DNA-binding NarL/FixJ family response regulator